MARLLVALGFAGACAVVVTGTAFRAALPRRPEWGDFLGGDAP